MTITKDGRIDDHFIKGKGETLYGYDWEDLAGSIIFAGKYSSSEFADFKKPEPAASEKAIKDYAQEKGFTVGLLDRKGFEHLY